MCWLIQYIYQVFTFLWGNLDKRTKRKQLDRCLIESGKTWNVPFVLSIDSGKETLLKTKIMISPNSKNEVLKDPQQSSQQRKKKTSKPLHTNAQQQTSGIQPDKCFQALILSPKITAHSMTKAPSSPKPAGIWLVFISTLYLSSLKHRLSEKNVFFWETYLTITATFMDICATQGSSKWRSSNSMESGCHLLSPGVINTFWTNIHHNPTRDTYVTCTTMPINPPLEEFPLYSCQKNNRKWTNIHKRLQTIEKMVSSFKPSPTKCFTNQMWLKNQPRWITITYHRKGRFE